MSSHPGATLNDAVEMALWLKKWGYSPEQVQDFYPTPGTISTVMYYTGIHPMTGKSVEVCTDYREKQLQRALLQFSRPENANLVREALRKAGREDLIGNGPECLVRAEFASGSRAWRPEGDAGRKAKSTAAHTRLSQKYGAAKKSSAKNGRNNKSSDRNVKKAPVARGRNAKVGKTGKKR